MLNIVVILALVNVLRGQPLIETKELDAMAQNRAEYICETGDFSHKYFLEFFSGSSYNTEGRLKGENLAHGWDTNLEVVLAWYKSTAHRQNMLNTTYKYTGIGQACGYVVQLFAA